MRATIAALAAATILLSATETASALDFESGPVQVVNLRVTSSEGQWQASDVFRLDWDQVPEHALFDPVTVSYQLYDQVGNPIGPVVHKPGAPGTIDRLRVPARGIYPLELWLEDSTGRGGAHVWTTLRFDDAAPPPPLPQAPTRWIAGNQPAILSLGHPVGAEPISGIRGYAVSTDAGGGSSPCSSPTHCDLDETDLLAGAGDTFSLGTLPEGSTVARVVAVSGAGVPSAVATAQFRVDATGPGVTLAGLPTGWVDGPVQLVATASDGLSGMAPTGPAGPFTAIAVDGRAPVRKAGWQVSAMVAGSGIHPVTSSARDAAGNVSTEAVGSAGVRIDEDPPQVAFAASQDPSEPERIEAAVADALSGPSESRGAIAVRPAGGRARFQMLPAEVARGKLVAHWDSDSFPHGKYEFLATGYDVAGNAASSSRRSPGGRMVLVNPLKTPTAIESGFGSRSLVLHLCRKTATGRRCRRRSIRAYDARPARRSVRYGHGVRYGGRLLTLAGSPLAGRELEVVETFAPGAGFAQRARPVRTGLDGTFSIQLPPGPSREVGVRFGGDRLLTRAAGRAVRLEVLAGVRLRASAPIARVGGAPVVFSGNVGRQGAITPREGLPVELQFRYPGADWTEFRTVQTDRRGRFRYPYRFSDDDSRGVRFQFRAYLGAHDGWPYEAAYSRPTAVTGS